MKENNIREKFYKTIESDIKSNVSEMKILDVDHHVSLLDTALEIDPEKVLKFFESEIALAVSEARKRDAEYIRKTFRVNEMLRSMVYMSRSEFNKIIYSIADYLESLAKK